MSSTWSYREEPNCHDVRYFGRSQSDFFDECGPALRRVLSLMFVLCNLSPVSAWHTPCARSKSSSCPKFRGRYRDKTHEQSEGAQVGGL